MAGNVNRDPAGTPGADLTIDVALVRGLLAAQHPDLAGLPVVAVANGWDNAMFRLGRDMAVRLPRRTAATALIVNEQRWLPVLAPTLPLMVPAPLRVGRPQDGYPWSWSILPWLEGETADVQPPGKLEGTVLARFFDTLHAPAPAEAPRNPFRGVPLAERAVAFQRRVESLAVRGEMLDPRLMETWAAALAEPIDIAAVWIHGDPHPRNILVNGGRITAVIDWGDLAQGDWASDLAAVWMVFPDPEERQRAVSAFRTVSASTWRRARGWAVLFGVVLLDAGLVDDPRMAGIARRALAKVVEGP